jgi:type III restriction enzyme
MPSPDTALEAWTLPERQCPHFSVEMETGTGKTYVYLRTVYELARRYGFRKFIIVVPSVAIREGVLKNIEITKEHFRALYNMEPEAAPPKPMRSRAVLAMVLIQP